MKTNFFSHPSAGGKGQKPSSSKGRRVGESRNPPANPLSLAQSVRPFERFLFLLAKEAGTPPREGTKHTAEWVGWTTMKEGKEKNERRKTGEMVRLGRSWPGRSWLGTELARDGVGSGRSWLGTELAGTELAGTELAGTELARDGVGWDGVG
uniref:Uncharacterized protein n=1 Tax=Globodera rostochiensis TaxID=31243 RepID=A0A914GYN0_GLORO